jgi:hypothetical protein
VRSTHSTRRVQSAGLLAHEHRAVKSQAESAWTPICSFQPFAIAADAQVLIANAVNPPITMPPGNPHETG